MRRKPRAFCGKKREKQKKIPCVRVFYTYVVQEHLRWRACEAARSRQDGADAVAAAVRVVPVGCVAMHLVASPTAEHSGPSEGAFMECGERDSHRAEGRHRGRWAAHSICGWR